MQLLGKLMNDCTLNQEVCTILENSIIDDNGAYGICIFISLTP